MQVTGRAVTRMSVATCGAVSVGASVQTYSASAATCGDAIDVPLSLPAPLGSGVVPPRFRLTVEKTFSPTAETCPKKFDDAARQPGVKSGAPEVVRFSTASVLASAGFAAVPTSARMDAAFHRSLSCAGPPAFPAEAACTNRSWIPARRTSSIQAVPSATDWLSVSWGRDPRLVLTTTLPGVALTAWMIRSPTAAEEMFPTSISFSCVLAGNRPVTRPAGVPLLAKLPAAVPTTW